MSIIFIIDINIEFVATEISLYFFFNSVAILT